MQFIIPYIKPIWLVREFNGFDLHPSWIVAFHLPALGAHVARAEEWDCSVAFADNNTVVLGSVRVIGGEDEVGQTLPSSSTVGSMTILSLERGSARSR